MSNRYNTQWDLQQAHCIEMLGLLRTIGQRGVRIDTDRLAALNADLDLRMAAISAELNEIPRIQEVQGFKVRKKLPTKLVDCPVCKGGEFITWKFLKNGKRKEVRCVAKCKEGKVKVPNEEGFIQQEILEFQKFEGGGGMDIKVTRWGTPIPFNPASSQQVINYIVRQGHRVPKKEGKPTTDQKQLAMLWRRHKDDVYKKIVEYRKANKLRGTYGEWPTVSRGDLTYACTTFRLIPDTGRLSSVNPNLQNVPKDGPDAEAFRRCIVSSPGHLLVRGDLSSAEALVTAYLADDPQWARLAKLGTHKFATAKYLGYPVSLEMTDEELKPLLNKAKDENSRLYRQMKIAIYGSTYLAGPKKLFENNPEDFANQSEAANFQKFVKSLSNKIAPWQARTILQATRAKELVNPFGYRKAFWDLPGSDGPAAVAFLPQSIVAAVMKECMLQLWKRESGRWMVLQIHDELVFDCPIEKAEMVAEEMREVFGQSWPELGGLRFGCEIKIGEDLA